MVDSTVNWIEEELRFAKSKSRNSECSWGRQVVLAISKNDSVGLLKIFNKHEDKKNLATHLNVPNINEQCTITGYADYMWTPLIHKFVGDTAIHLACKQGRETCVSVLLLLGADCNITNKNGESAHLLSLKYLNKSIENIEFDSLRNFFSNTHTTFHELCPLALYRNLKAEAWQLMKSGRCLYTDLPKSFIYNQDNIGDKNSSRPYLSFNLSEEEPAPIDVEYWLLRLDENGTEYFYNEISGESTYIKPNATVINENEDFLQNATQEYYNFLNSTEIEKPESFRSLTESLKQNVIVMEKIDRKMKKIRATPKELKKMRNEEEKLQYMEEKKIREANFKLTAAKKAEYEQKLRQQALLERDNKSLTPAGKAMGEGSWVRGNIADVISFVERQKRRTTQDKIADSMYHRARGLPLLNNVHAQDRLDRLTEKEQHIFSGEINQVDLEVPVVPPEVEVLQVPAPSPSHTGSHSHSDKKGVDSSSQKLEARTDPNPLSSMAMSKDVTFGISKLKFIKMSDLDKVSAEASAVAEKRMLSQPTNISSPSAGSKDPRPLVYASDKKNALAFSYSETTCLSTRTNMKYMNIGDNGVKGLSTALRGDRVITQLTLAGARMTSVGAVALAEVLPEIHGLEYLDLSSNVMCDAGAAAIAKAILNSSGRLQRVILAGNRFTLSGVLDIIQAVERSTSILYCNISNNKLTSFDNELVFKLMAELNYISTMPAEERESKKIHCHIYRRGNDTIIPCSFPDNSEINVAKRDQTILF